MFGHEYGLAVDILNAPTKLMKAIGYGDGYRYDHDTPEAFSGQSISDAWEGDTLRKLNERETAKSAGPRRPRLPP